jgi:hypothetical protein
MPAIKSLAFAAALMLATLALTAVSAGAQGAAPNPSGGTSAYPSPGEGSGPALEPARGDAPIGSLRGWFLGLRMSRQSAFLRSWGFQGRTLTVIVPRQFWER